ncbi:MAG: hypothetical protein Q8K82_08765 [Gemmatimonadaceae bacterium]|nr:hypothetical protein [Gemmatimonadaceae bacterium]
MRSTLHFSKLLPCLALVAAGCSVDSSFAVAPQVALVNDPSLVLVGPGCTYPYVTGGILAPTNADNSSVFELGRTVPLKIRVTDCVTQAAVDGATPVVTLSSLGEDGTLSPVNEVISSSAADEGTTMRPAGNGQYIFNLSTKRSQFYAGRDLAPGRYEVRISEQFEDVVVQFTLRP